jgi:hypothetical protein
MDQSDDDFEQDSNNSVTSNSEATPSQSAAIIVAESPEAATTPTPASKSSVVHDFFNIIERKNKRLLECQICVKTKSVPVATYSYNHANTSGALKHLRTTKSHLRHLTNIQLTSLGLKPQQSVSTPIDFFAKKHPEPEHHYDANVFEQKLIRLVICRDLPFSLVDWPETNAIVKYLRPETNVMSRATLMRRINVQVETRRNELRQRLASLSSKFSVTLDVWTSKNQLSFLGITCHYIDSEWNLYSNLLAFEHLEGSHSGEAIGTAVYKVLTSFGVASKLLAVTTDNASNNDTMMERLSIFSLQT